MAKVFVATHEKQGVRKSDFCFANDGEVVRFVSECDGEAIDGRCGCRRSMAGVDTGKCTTTIKVADLAISKEDLVHRVKDGLAKQGWGRIMDVMKAAEDEVNELLRIADVFEDAADELECVEFPGMY